MARSAAFESVAEMVRKNREKQKTKQKEQQDRTGWNPKRSDLYNSIAQKVWNGGYDIGVTDADVAQFIRSSQSYFKDSAEKLKSGGWSDIMDPTASVTRKQTEQTLLQDSDKVRQWANLNRKARGDEWYGSMMKYLDDMDTSRATINQGYAEARKYYSQWESQDAYDEYLASDEAKWLEKYQGKTYTQIKTALRSAETQEEKDWASSYAESIATVEDREAELGRAKSELQYLERAQADYNRLRFVPDMYPNEPGYKELKAEYDIRMPELQNLNLDQLVPQKKAEISRLEKSLKYSSLDENEDFSYYSAQGAAIKNPSPDDAEGYIDLFGWRPGADEVGNIVTYSRDNYDTIAAMSEGGRYDVVGDIRYKSMTEDEVAIYNYLLAKEGKEKAGEYLSYIEENLNAREGKKIAGAIKSIDIPVIEQAVTGLYGLGAGLDQWASGTKQFFTNEQRPTTITQYANADIANSLTGFGKYAYTGANVVGNMLPSIFMSYATGGLGVPDAIANGVGVATTGVSAAGNAQGDALRDGYSADQARTYGTLVGASEAVLQYILGGIGSLGGISDDLLKAKIDMIDNSLLRVSAKLGADVLSEVAEEELQNYLEPAFRSIVFGEDYDAPTLDEIIETAIVTAITTPVLGGVNTVKSDLYENRPLVKAGKYIMDADGGVDALMNLANEVAGVTSPDMHAALTEKASKVSQKATPRNVGKLYNTVQTANVIANASANQADIAKSLKRKGFTPYEANEIAGALVANYNGQELTRAQKKILNSVKDNKDVQTAITSILDNSQSTMGQRSQNIRDFEKDIVHKRLSKLVAETTPEENSTPDTSTPVAETAVSVPSEVSEPTAATIDSNTYLKDAPDTPVKIKEVASIKSGKMTLRLEDGREVDASDISYGSEAEAMVYETVARLCTHAKAANLLISAFKTGDVPALNYSKGIMEAHEYGKYNFSEEDMMRRGSFVKDLTPYQRYVAYQVGQIFGGRETAREHAAVRRPKNSKASIKEGKVHFEGDRSKLNDTQKASLDVMEMLSKALGVQIYIFESATDTDGKHTGKNGWYDLRDGSIHIDLNAGMDGKGTMLFTAAHELTHFIRQWSPAKFKVLANFLISQYYAKGVSVQELIDGQIAKAKRDGRTLDRDAAYEEVVADSMETMLTDGNVLQQLAELQQRDKTLWEKIRGWFKDFANKLKAVIKAYDGAKPDSVEGRLVSDMQGVVEILEALYVDALTDASANYAAGAQKNTAGGGVKYSIVALDDGRVYVKASRNIITGSTKSDQRRNITDFFNSLLDGQPSLDIYTIEGDILTISKAQTAKKARDDYKSVGGTPVKMTDSEFAVKMHIEAHIDEIAEVSRSSNQKSDTKNHAFAQSGFTYRRAYFEDFDGQYYEITLSIGKNGSIATVYNVGKIDKSVPPSAKIIAVVGSKALGGTLSKNSIRNSSGVVNQKFSVCDSKGNQLSEAQQNFFRDSKIRDKEGRLLVLYHQTDGDFTIFDTRHTGAGSNDGGTPFGIFLKRSPADIGLSGKKQMALYANITNPLRATNREDLDRQLRKISGRYAAISDRVKNLDVEYQRKIDQAQTAWNDYVKKWREANPNAKRADLYGDPKFNELFDAEDDLADEWTTVSDRLSVQAKEVITEDLRKAGHDGIFLEEDMGSWGRRTDAIIALDPKQVKDTSNQNPTDNPDIRYSTRDPATQKLQQALEKENARLKEDITYLKELLALQRKVTGGTKFTKSSVTAAAQMLKKNANAKGDTKELATLLNTFYEYIATEKELTWAGVKEQAQASVQWLQDHVNLKPQRSEYAREVLQQIRGSRIYLDESQKAEAAHRFGSFNDFRKSIMGNVTIVKDGNTSLDSFWQEMTATYPDIFSRETASGDMPGELFEIIGRLRNSDTSRVEYEYNRDSIAMDLLQQVYDSYWRVSNLRTATDSAQKKINVLRFKHNEQMSKLRAEKNAKIDSLKEEYRAELDKVRKEHKADTEAKVQDIRDKYTSARERAVEGRKRTEVKHKIQKVVQELNNLLLKEDKKRHVPDSMKKAVAAALDFIQLDTVNAEERIAKYDALIAEATDPDVIDSLMVTRQNLVDKGEKIGDRLKELHEAYADIMASDDPDISSGVDPVIDGNLRELRATIGDTPFSKLSMEQLEDVYSMYKMVLTRIRDANKSFLSDQNKSISDRATSDIRQVRAVGGEHKFLKDNKRRQFWWNNLKPVYAIEKIGGGELKKAFWQLIKGEGTYALDTSGARDFAEDMQQKHKYNSWDMKKQYSFTSTSGVEFSLNLEQIMSLYAFSRRDQALDHLRIGGFVFDSSIVLDSIEEKNPKTGKVVKKKGRWIVNSADAHQISADILGDIISVLDADQIAFVDAMQGYLSDTMGAKGNDVSMAMYGIKLFKEKHYFPLKTASSYMFQQNEVAGEVKLKNAGFTQKTTPRANNPIILRNFMDVWAGHVHDMSMYHSFTLAIEDFNRIFNYTSPRVEGTTPDSLRRTIQNAYGSEAVKYLRDMIVDLNGGVRSDSREATFKKLMSRWKKSSVAGSLSVAIQQPSALLRAKALVDDRYFITVNPKLLSSGALWKELRTYAPIAIIKEMGRFDMDTGVGTIDYIKGTKKTFMDHVDKVTGFLPEKADQWAWAQIWVAVKKEVAAKQPDLSGKAYLEACGDRFTEVIVKTQVYDSTLSRSANMRSKSAFMQMATAFMAEPTTAINMIEDAIRQYRRGYKQQAKKTIRAVIDSTIANAILVSLIYALRDDDEDETFAEKYAGALTQELIDGFNPLTYFPLTKDVWSIFQGYDVERSDMSLIADLANTVKKIGRKMIKDTGSMDETEVQDHYREATGIAWDLVGTVANCFGIPVKNISRDVEACINGVKTFRKGPSNNTRSFWNKVGDAAQETIPFLELWNDSATDDLYEAVVARDTAYVERVQNKYQGKETAYTTALRKALRENDSRIQDAAHARHSMDTEEYLRIVEEIVAEGHFDEEDVVAAVRTAYNNLKGDDSHNKLYNAMLADDEATVEKLKGNYINDKGKFSDTAYHSAIQKGLRENDARIKKAAEAKAAGDTDTYFEIVEEIVDEGHFKWKDVSAAVTDEVKEMSE